jgi:hypothetical protein
MNSKPGGRDSPKPSAYRSRGPYCCWRSAAPISRFRNSSKVNGSRHAALRELRVQHQGRPYRVLYAFDPRRVAILLLGGDKTGDDRWYEKNVPLADRLYDNYLAGIEEEDDAKDDKVQ